MNEKRPGEGLHIIWEIIRKGIEYRWQSAVELWKEFWSITNDNKHL